MPVTDCKDGHTDKGSSSIRASLTAAPGCAAGLLQWRTNLGSALFAALTFIHGSLMLVPTEAGRVHALGVQNGQALWSLSLSSAPCNTQAATWPPLCTGVHAGGAGPGNEKSGRARQPVQSSDVAVISADGFVHSFRIKDKAEPPDLSSCHVADAETFSGPVLLPNWTAVLGARDDCLHCVQVKQQQPDQT